MEEVKGGYKNQNKTTLFIFSQSFQVFSSKSLKLFPSI